eukprot:UN10895
MLPLNTASTTKHFYYTLIDLMRMNNLGRYTSHHRGPLHSPIH